MFKFLSGIVLGVFVGSFAIEVIGRVRTGASRIKREPDAEGVDEPYAPAEQPEEFAGY